jgi:hypothetical protein
MGGDVTLGAFRPGKQIIERLSADQEVRVNPGLVEPLHARLNEPVQVNDGKFYLGRDPSAPHVGDMQISYALAPAGAVSIVGRQSGSDFVHYQTRAGDALLIVDQGTMSTADMFKQAERGNAVVTWLIRAFSALIMYIGFLLILNPLVVVADVLPLIGNILGAGASLVSLIVTVVLVPSIIAVAWLWYRPLVSVVVIAVGIALAIWLKMRADRKAARSPAPAAV